MWVAAVRLPAGTTTLFVASKRLAALPIAPQLSCRHWSKTLAES
jgi:hypothetical protein